jgi:hypothetical protein
MSIKRDLAQARSQRSIPLAGDEEEQARIVPSPSRNAPAKIAGDSVKPAASAGWKPEAASGKPDVPAKTAGAESGTASLPDTGRRDQAVVVSDSGSHSGEYIQAELGNGLTSIAIITPVGDLSMREIQRQTPLADRIYYKVLSKGEALPPKEGRADDFRWRGEEVTRSQ